MEERFMKKILVLLLTMIMVIGLVTGCSAKKETEETTADPTKAPADTTETTEDVTEETTEDTTEETAAPAAAKTGFAVITSLAKSKDAAADADGLAQVDSTLVAVLVGQDGKILDCKIDAAQTKVNFSAAGLLVTDKATVYKTKQELGTEYGMLKNSTIGKEWNEQANALAVYVIGKTVDEVKGIAVNEEGVATDADLAASVTVGIDGYIAAIEKAVANAQELGAVEGDQIGLGTTTTIAKSKDAAADADGLAQAYSNYSVITVNAEGKITSCIIDGSQGNVNFSAAGVVTTDLTVAPQTKQELKEGYGMLKNSAIGKEWYEQANAFAVYVTGKTLDEVKGIAVNEEGGAADADLAASVSVGVDAFIANIDKAVANAAQ
jgi:hypothetical protein